MLVSSVEHASEHASPVRSRRLEWSAALALPVIILLAAVIRFYHINALSLWLDEGLTVLFVRLPWRDFVASPQLYGIHPPIYYLAVKLMSLASPERIAGRLVSAVAAIATIPILYQLVARLLGRRAAVCCTVVLAVSPLHVWYAQEARPYALAVFLVCASYLALIRAMDGGSRWAVVYGVSLAAALYTEYSAIFALLPQGLLLVLAIRRHRPYRYALVAAGCAALAYLPWLPRLAQVAGPASRQPQFQVSLSRIGDTLLSVSGLAANESVFDGRWLPPWDRWPAAHAALLVVLACTALAGTLALARQGRRALLVGGGLGPGAILCAAVISCLFPGYTERTVLAATLGWSIIAGAALLCSALPRWLALAGRAAALIVLLCGLMTLAAQDTDAYKQHWDDLAGAVAAAEPLGWPIATYPTVAATLIELYQPWLRSSPLVSIDDGESLPSSLVGRDASGGIWLAYQPVPGIARLWQQLARAGYVRVLHDYYPYPLYLDLYVRPAARLGRSIPVNGLFLGAGERAAGWFLPSRGAALVPDGHGRRLVLTAQTGEVIASAAVPAVERHLYIVTYQMRSHLQSGVGRAFLICATPSYSFLSVAPDAAGDAVPNDGAWHTGSIAVLCPAGTRLVQIELRNSGRGRVDIRDVTLLERV